LFGWVVRGCVVLFFFDLVFVFDWVGGGWVFRRRWLSKLSEKGKRVVDERRWTQHERPRTRTSKMSGRRAQG